METKDIQLKILAQAVYELRLLLSNHLGSRNDALLCESISAHLAYALHNEALAVLEDRPVEFEVEKALNNIKRVDEMFDQNFLVRFEKLVRSNES